MSASTVPAVRAKLVELLKAELKTAGDTKTQVTFGHPGIDGPRRYIAVCDTEQGATRTQHTLPLRRNSSREEDYTLRLVIWAFTGDFTQMQAVVLQAWTLANLVDDLLRRETGVDRTPPAGRLGGLVDQALPARFDDADFRLVEGLAAEIVVSVNVHVTRS